MERIIDFRPAFDKRHPDPKKNYGIHGLEMLFIVKGDEGAVQLVIYTNWMLKSCRKDWNDTVKAITMLPIAADIGYHSKKAVECSTEIKDCNLTGGKCYYDGSSLNAEPYLELLIEEGQEPVWNKMEEYYNKVFHP